MLLLRLAGYGNRKTIYAKFKGICQRFQTHGYPKWNHTTLQQTVKFAM